MKDTQTYIVRQSSLKFVNDYMTLIGTPVGVYETVALAEIITNYVLNGRTKEINERLQNFDKFVMEETSRDLLNKIKFDLNTK